MKTDYELLGIEQTDDLAAVRAAYRKAAKAVHPDLGSEDEAFRNHLLFIEITRAYERLAARLSGASAQPGGGPAVARAGERHSGERGIVPHKDPAYAYYKTAMRCFARIHPSYWRLDVKNALEMPSPAREQELSRIQGRTRELLSLFPRAPSTPGVCRGSTGCSSGLSDLRQAGVRAASGRLAAEDRGRSRLSGRLVSHR